MTATLSPQALRSNAALIRFLASAEGLPTSGFIATALGRDESNLAKSLKLLEGAGVIARRGAGVQLTLVGQSLLDQLPAEAPKTSATPANAVRDDAPEGFAAIHHQLIVPDSLNPREAFDDEALNELADSIARDGLLQNLVVRPAAPMDGYGQPMHRLVAGERRWRAIGKLIARGDWPADKPAPVKISALDDSGHAVVALLENLQRQDLKPLEEARAFKRLVDHHGFKTADIATRINASQRLVQQRLQLLELPDDRQAALDAGKITIEDARRWLAAKPAPLSLTPAQIVMLLEVADRVAALEEPSLWTSIPVDCAAGGADFEALAALNFFHAGLSYETGHALVHIRYAIRRALEQYAGVEDFDRAAIAKALYQARLDLVASCAPEHIPAILAEIEAGRYVTPWLNPPFTISDEAREQIVAFAAQREENERAREEQQRRARADAECRAALMPAFRKMIDGGGVQSIAPADVIKAAEAAWAPLPWTWLEDDDATRIVDAAGDDIDLEDISFNGGLGPLIMALINTAGGFAPRFVDAATSATPPSDPSAEAPPGASAGAPFPVNVAGEHAQPQEQRND